MKTVKRWTTYTKAYERVKAVINRKGEQTNSKYDTLANTVFFLNIEEEVKLTYLKESNLFFVVG